MRVAVSSDEVTGVARELIASLQRRGHELLRHGALAAAGPTADGDERGSEDADPARNEDAQWAWASEAAARDVTDGRAELAVVCCWTGTGASIAANKVPGVRAALCHDAATATGARRWNDANVLALSLRSTSQPELEEILDAFLGTSASDEAWDRANVEHLGAIERRL
ncbi:MAG: RpiB/LacA/LacB family sugar-phosphate isomerase [Solirubrobacteraceae bacterium]